MALKNWKKEIDKVKTKAQATQLAIEFQDWQSEKSLSWGELITYQNQFRVLAKKFGLVREFKENGII